MWITNFLAPQTRTKLRLLLLDDPVLISFPKSGRTWVRVMMRELGIPVIQDHAGAKGTGPIDTGLYHNKRVMLLVRDPRDTVVSFYHHSRTRLKQGYDGTISDFIRDPGLGVERIVEFNKAWLTAKTRPRRFVLLEYERLREDTEGEMRHILTFLDRHDISEQALQSAITESSFDKLRQVEASGGRAAFGRSLKPGNTADPDSFKVRKGKVGGFAEELSEPDILYCNEILEKHDYENHLNVCRNRLTQKSAGPRSDVSASGASMQSR